ncbi:cysteine-rich secretory protein 3-like [Rhynchonycteris naso]
MCQEVIWGHGPELKFKEEVNQEEELQKPQFTNFANFVLRLSCSLPDRGGEMKECDQSDGNGIVPGITVSGCCVAFIRSCKCTGMIEVKNIFRKIQETLKYSKQLDQFSKVKRARTSDASQGMVALTHMKNEDFNVLLTSKKDVQIEIVNTHNDLRRSVFPPASNMLKMEWDSKAAENAQKWADKCIFSHSKKQDRTIGERSCGENLFQSSYPVSWTSVIQNWFAEKENFVYGLGPKHADEMTGHYTQVVWYSSFKVGCGFAYCPNQETAEHLFVCQYCPAGNIRSNLSFPYLQGTPCASCPKDCDHGLCLNSCEYQDMYSNCKDLKDNFGCEESLVKNNCKGSCNCSGKIY